MPSARRLLALAGLPLLAGTAAACGDDDVTDSAEAEGEEAAGELAGDEADATAELQDANSTAVGDVRFHDNDGTTRVVVEIDELDTEPGFHGFHIHANDDSTNGEGCSADPNQPADTWFASADGHLSRQGQRHGNHQGDLPSLLVHEDGSATAEFETGGFSLADVEGTAVVVHALADNFGRVPTGNGPEQYTPNSPRATAETADTGNAGDRIACGIIEMQDTEDAA